MFLSKIPRTVWWRQHCNHLVFCPGLLQPASPRDGPHFWACSRNLSPYLGLRGFPCNMYLHPSWQWRFLHGEDPLPFLFSPSFLKMPSAGKQSQKRPWEHRVGGGVLKYEQKHLKGSEKLYYNKDSCQALRCLVIRKSIWPLKFFFRKLWMHGMVSFAKLLEQSSLFRCSLEGTP